jgi:hypothetical protein
MTHVASSIVPIKFQLSTTCVVIKVPFYKLHQWSGILESNIVSKKLQGNKYNHLVF